jgi:hypothetical protein
MFVLLPQRNFLFFCFELEHYKEVVVLFIKQGESPFGESPLSVLATIAYFENNPMIFISLWLV